VVAGLDVDDAPSLLPHWNAQATDPSRGSDAWATLQTHLHPDGV
jgi:hypothetical protein